MRAAAMARRGLLVAMLVIAVSPSVAFARDRTASSILRAMNSVRAHHRLPALRVNRSLARAAVAHSSEMARSGLFSHGAFEARLRGYVRSRAIGENLAWMSRCNGREAVRMWLRSAPHREVMLARRFRRVGVAHRSSSRFCFITADFATAR
jgi:uncharacterized protein YkwD